MSKTDNLTHKLTAEECSRGGKSSGKKRRLKGAIANALKSKASSAEFAELFESFGIKERDRDYAAAIACAIAFKAAHGDVQSAVYLRDTVGEKAALDEPSSGQEVVIIDDIKA